MKKKKIIITVILCLVCGVIGYFGTLKLDELKKGGDIKIIFTLADTKTYVIPNANILDKEKAKEEWPYEFSIENKDNGSGYYQILIKDVSGNLKRDDLSCILLLDDKEVLNIEMKDIKNNVLYQGDILPNNITKGKLYVWNNHKEKENEELSYEYSLELEAIKKGGPGF